MMSDRFWFQKSLNVWQMYGQQITGIVEIYLTARYNQASLSGIALNLETVRPNKIGFIGGNCLQLWI